MKAPLVFLVVWVTASFLLMWLVDFNLYIKYPDGHLVIKDYASWCDRLFYSGLIGCAFSALDVGLIYSVGKLIAMMPRR
jgi:hypothetical protein